MLPPGRDSPRPCPPSPWPAAPSPGTPPQWPRSQRSGMFGAWNARPSPCWWSFSPAHPGDPPPRCSRQPPLLWTAPAPPPRAAPPPGSLTPVTRPLLRDILLQPQPQLRGPVALPGGPRLHQDEVGVIVVQGAEGALAASVVQGIVHRAGPLGTHAVRPRRGLLPQMEGGLLLLWGAPREGTLQTEPCMLGGGGSTHGAAWLSGDLPQAPVCVGQRTPVSPRSQSLQGGGRAGRLGASLGGVFGNQVPTPGLCRLGAWQPPPHSGPGRCCLLLASHWAGGLGIPSPLPSSPSPCLPPPPPALGPAPPTPWRQGTTSVP